MRIAITTLGCKVNQYDSAVIQGRLEADRHSVVPFEEKADFYIIKAILSLVPTPSVDETKIGCLNL